MALPTGHLKLAPGGEEQGAGVAASPASSNQGRGLASESSRARAPPKSREETLLFLGGQSEAASDGGCGVSGASAAASPGGGRPELEEAESVSVTEALPSPKACWEGRGGFSLPAALPGSRPVPSFPGAPPRPERESRAGPAAFR